MVPRINILVKALSLESFSLTSTHCFMVCTPSTPPKFMWKIERNCEKCQVHSPCLSRCWGMFCFFVCLIYFYAEQCAFLIVKQWMLWNNSKQKIPNKTWVFMCMERLDLDPGLSKVKNLQSKSRHFYVLSKWKMITLLIFFSFEQAMVLNRWGDYDIFWIPKLILLTLLNFHNWCVTFRLELSTRDFLGHQCVYN